MKVFTVTFAGRHAGGCAVVVAPDKTTAMKDLLHELLQRKIHFSHNAQKGIERCMVEVNTTTADVIVLEDGEGI